MKSPRKATISESEDSEEDEILEKTSFIESKHKPTNSSTSSSSESEEPKRPPTPTPNRKSTSPKKRESLNLDSFLSKNPDLKKIVIDDPLTEEDDVCLLEVLKNINPMDFMEKSINFDQKTKVKLNRVKYVIEPVNDEIKSINLLTKKLKVVHPVSVLKMREYTKHKKDNDFVNVEPVSVSLPENLKVRHPLFGAEYENKIVLNEEIQNKLDFAIKETLKKKHKKEKKKSLDETDSNTSEIRKKKHVKKETESFEEAVDESLFALLETHIAEKNLRVSNVKEEHEIDLEHEKKKKKKNKSLENESSSQDEKKNKKMKSHGSVKDEGRSSQSDEDIKSKSKWENDSNIKTEGKKEKKKRNSSIKEEEKTMNGSQPSTEHKIRVIKEARLLEPDSSEEKIVKKEKKKYNNFEEENTSELNPSNSSLNIKKEKRKHKNLNMTNSLGCDNKDDADTDMEEKKRKRKHSRSFTDEQNNSESQSEKRKHKRNVTEEINPVNDTIRESKVSVKKEKNNSLANSTVIPGLQLPLFEFDVSNIASKDQEYDNESSRDGEEENIKVEFNESKKKKDKKNKSPELKHNIKKEMDETKHLLSKAEEVSTKRKKCYSENQVSTPKKKIKKEKLDSEETNSLILDLLNKVKNEMDSSVNHKKKRKSDR